MGCEINLRYHLINLDQIKQQGQTNSLILFPVYFSCTECSWKNQSASNQSLGDGDKDCDDDCGVGDDDDDDENMGGGDDDFDVGEDVDDDEDIGDDDDRPRQWQPIRRGVHLKTCRSRCSTRLRREENTVSTTIHSFSLFCSWKMLLENIFAFINSLLCWRQMPFFLKIKWVQDLIVDIIVNRHNNLSILTKERVFWFWRRQAIKHLPGRWHLILRHRTRPL